MRCVASFHLWAECPALDGFAENGSGLTGAKVFCGCFICGVDLSVVMTTAWQVHKVFVAEMCDKLQQPRISSEEVSANVGSISSGQTLELAVHGGVQFVQQNSVNIFGKKLVPL